MTARNGFSLRVLAAPLLAVSLLSLVSPVSWSQDAGAVRAAIEQAGVRFAEAFGKGDAKAVAAFYTADAIAFPPGGEMAKGRDAIQQLWQSIMDSGVKSLSFTVVDVGTSGDVAYETGTVELKIQPPGQASTNAAAKYVVVWKKQGNDWKLHRDIWNDLPAK